MRFRSDKTIQNELFAFSHRDIISKDSDVWLYIDLFDSLDFQSFEKVYSGEGEVPIDPKLLVRTIFYGLTHGIYTGRKLMNACVYDNRFIVLSGRQEPNRSTFDRFIIRHDKNIYNMFKQVVLVAKELGLVSLGQITIDGTRFRAHTNVHKSVKYEKIDKIMKHVEEKLDQLKKDLENDNTPERPETLMKELKNTERRREKILSAKKKIEEEYAKRNSKNRPIGKISKSLNDQDALALSHKSKTNGFMYGYNAQVATGGENQIVVACAIHDEATDYRALPKLLDKINDDYQEQPKELLMDLGYKSNENLEILEKREIDAYVGVNSSEYKETEIQSIEQLTALEAKHEYSCLADKKLLINGRRKDGRTSLKFSDDFCKDCSHSNQCKLYGKKTFEVPERSNFIRLNSLFKRSRTEKFKKIYSRRKVNIEPVFGNVKYNKFFKLYVTGIKKVSLRVSMIFLAHNIEKIINKGLLNKYKDFQQNIFSFFKKMSQLYYFSI